MKHAVIILWLHLQLTNQSRESSLDISAGKDIIKVYMELGFIIIRNILKISPLEIIRCTCHYIWIIITNTIRNLIIKFLTTLCEWVIFLYEGILLRNLDIFIPAQEYIFLQKIPWRWNYTGSIKLEPRVGAYCGCLL